MDPHRRAHDPTARHQPRHRRRTAYQRRRHRAPHRGAARRGVPARTAAALESIGYHLVTGIDPRNQAAHRFTRGIGHVDLLTSDEDGDEVDELEVQKHVKKQDEQQSDIVDVLVADHAALSVEEMLRGKAMVKVEGATQALRRTVNVVLEITPGVPTTISVPGPFGALILKAAAYQTDSRDRERHPYDAAATRLVRQVTEHFRTLGHEVLWGTCVRFATASVPFAPVAQALDSWALHVDPTVRSAVLEGSDALSPCRSCCLLR